MAETLSTITRNDEATVFGRADVFFYDDVAGEFVSFGYVEDAQIEISWEEAILRSGSPATVVRREIKQLDATLTVNIRELSVQNLERMLPSQISNVTTGAIIEAYEDVVTLSGTAQSKLRFTNVESAPDIEVRNAQNLTAPAYVKESAPGADDNDYAIDYVTGEINRTTTSAIPDNSQVACQYFHNDTLAKVINVAPGQCSSSAATFQRLRIISRERDCAYRGAEIFRAVPLSPLVLPWIADFGNLETKFAAQEDPTRPRGFNFVQYIQGTGAQV